MKVLFIYTDIGISVGYSCGIGVLSAFLKEHGHETKLIHVSDELDYALDLEHMLRDIREYDPGLIAFSAVTNQWYYVRQIAKYLRRYLSVPIVVGGHHANAAPHQVIAEEAVDFACKGEGERPLLELVERLARNDTVDNIPNMVVNRKTLAGRFRLHQEEESNGNGLAVVGAGASSCGSSSGKTSATTSPVQLTYSTLNAATVGRVGHEGNGHEPMDVVDNPMGRWVDDLDGLPYEDHEIFDYARIVDSRRGWAEVIASRGCPYACTYCFNVPFFNQYKNDLKGTDDSVTMRDFVRRRTPEKTVEMLLDIKTNFPNVKFFTFVDDVFAIYSRWLADLAPMYRDRVGVPFACTSQPLAFNESIASLLKLMGCKVVKMGVESGNVRIRNQVLNRNIPDKVLIRDFELARQHGLMPQAFNMIGLPTETRENMLETARLNAQLRAYIVWVSTFMPYPGTVLDKFCQDQDLINPDRWDDVRSYRGGSVLREKTFTYLELEQMRVMFRWQLNAALGNECSDEYRRSIEEFEHFDQAMWSDGRAEEMFTQRDGELDESFRKRHIDHYVNKKYVNILWAKDYNYDLS